MYLQCFFRFWNVDVNVPWTFSTIRSKELLRYDSNVSKRSWPFNVPDRSPFLTVTITVPDRYHDRSLPFLSVLDRSANGQERPGTVMVTVRNGHGNAQERWTVWDVERYATIILYKTNGLKRLQNHVHVSKTKETLYH